MIIRFIFGFLLLALLLAGGVYLFGVTSIERSLPMYEGEIEIADLKRPINIYRDEFGISHIDAETDEDAYYGLGYVHAEERMFQMDFARRLGQGQLAEVLGQDALIIDKWSRTIGFARIAQEMWKRTSKETQKAIIAYTNGVNAYIEERHGKFGFEFDALRYEPRWWRPTDCMVIGRLMSWEMNFSYWNDAAFGDIALAVSPAKLRSIMPNYDGPTVLEGNVAPRPIPKTIIAVDSALDSAGTQVQDSSVASVFRSLQNVSRKINELTGALAMGGGSNAIAISPKRSATGGAILENDMHLVVSNPARFYVTHLKSMQGLNVAGFTIPGLPIVVSGRSESVSWGVTNGMIDELDYFILDAEGASYKTPGGTKYLKKIIENIAVRDLEKNQTNIVPLTITQSEYGPVINDISTFEVAKFIASDTTHSIAKEKSSILGKNKVVTLMWNGMKTTGDEIGAYLRLHKAKNATDNTLLADFATPCLNMCLADTKGNIRYQLIGRIPKRNGDEESLLLPRRASDGADGWYDHVSTPSLPSLTNPSEGFLVSANNPATAYRNFPYSNNWDPPGRVERLRQLLKTPGKFDERRLSAIVRDVSGPFEKLTLAPHIIRVMRGTQDFGGYDKLTEEALEYLENWDGRQSEIDVATTICNVFLLRLTTDALIDDIGTDLLNEMTYISNVPTRTMANILRDENNILWDDVRSPQRETRDTIIKYAFRESVKLLKQMMGTDSRMWNWGRLHSLTYRHPFSRFSEHVAKLGDVYAGYAPGGLMTPYQATYSLWKPFEMVVGPVMRQVSDMKTTNISVALPTGNSGNMFSPHYGDMAQMFKRGDFYSFDLKHTPPNAKLLKLVPGK
jgi:penicillin G amidase